MAEASRSLLRGWIERLRAGDAAARNELLKHACERLRRLARRMLQDFGRVKRWEDTDDVLQYALLRLVRALDAVPPASVQEFFRLAAVQIRRELLDLARRYYGPEGHGANHASDGGGRDPEEALPYEKATTTLEPGRLAAWSEFHQRVEALPDEERAVFDVLRLLTGQAPCQGSTLHEVLDRIKRGDIPSPRQRNKDIPPALEAICLKAMVRKPEARYATALDLAADVEHWLADEPVAASREALPARLGRWLRRHRAWAAGIAALLLTAVVRLVAELLAVNHQKRLKEQALQAESQAKQLTGWALDDILALAVDDGPSGSRIPKNAVCSWLLPNGYRERCERRFSHYGNQRSLRKRLQGGESLGQRTKAEQQRCQEQKR